MQGKEHTFGEKLREIIIEILIITFAITLSIQLHSWSEHRHQQKEAEEFMTDLKADLQKDIAAMREQQITLKQSDSSFTDFMAVSQHIKKGERMNRETKIHLLNRVPNNGYYEGFKFSGKIGYIENKEIRNDILSYYQDKEPQLSQLEQLSKKLSIETCESLFSKRNASEIWEDSKLMAKIGMMLQVGSQVVQRYGENIQTAQKIIAEIDKEQKH